MLNHVSRMPSAISGCARNMYWLLYLPIKSVFAGRIIVSTCLTFISPFYVKPLVASVKGLLSDCPSNPAWLKHRIDGRLQPSVYVVL